MKTMFQRLHRTTLIAFPLLSILLLIDQMLFGQWPVILLALWVISLSLLIMVLLACITRNVALHWQAGTIGTLLRRYLIGAAAAAAVLVALDCVAGHILWLTDLGVGLLLGLLALYAKP